LTVALISQGTAAENAAKAEELGLRDVLLQTHGEVAEAYDAHGTPTAVAIGTDGKMTSRVVGGARAIEELVHGKSRSRLEVVQAAPKDATTVRPSWRTSPVPVGDPAPALAWNDLDGRAISLRALQGAPTILLFWHPRCGFCTRLLPDVRTWEARRRGGEQLIVISSGSPAENRALGLTSPIILEEDFRTGTRLGVTGTPSALAIGADSRIAVALAVGAPAVLELLFADGDDAHGNGGLPLSWVEAG
jgi:peroxiredoxin